MQKWAVFHLISKLSLDILKFPLFFLYELLMSLRNLILNPEEIYKTDNGSDHSWHSKMFAIDYLGTRKFWVTNIKQGIEAFPPYSWNLAQS